LPTKFAVSTLPIMVPLAASSVIGVHVRFLRSSR
jgi:hypothetical protein